MNIFLKILGYLSIALIALSVYSLIRSLKRSRRIRPGSLLFEMTMSVVLLWVYVGLLHITPRGALSWPLLVVGLGLGYVASNATSLTVSDEGVLGQRAVWYLGVWGASFAVTQLLALVASADTVAWGVASVYFSTGLGVGTNCTLLLRQADLQATRPRVAPAGPAVPALAVAAGAQATDVQSAFCAGCGRPLDSGFRFCSGCGRPISSP